MAADKFDTGLYETALAALGISPNGAAPRCEHADAIKPVPPRRPYAACQYRETAWLGLLVCLTCGWVALVVSRSMAFWRSWGLGW